MLLGFRACGLPVGNTENYLSGRFGCSQCNAFEEYEVFPKLWVPFRGSP